MKENIHSLYIPVNIKRRKEWVDGFGAKELKYTIIWSIIGLIYGLIMYFIKDKEMMYIIFSVILFAGSTVILTRKDKTNRSTIDYILMNYKFMNSQKIYKYKYHNIYEKEVKVKK